jgi:L-lactate dehydrogenase complex protein LldF
VTGDYSYSESFGARAEVSLARPQLRAAVAEASDRAAAVRTRALSTLPDADGLRDVAARIRDGVLSRLDMHLERLADGWTAAGGRVYFAADAADARAYICSVARAAGARLAVKSKSMASEEIELNRGLADIGVEAVETDLGEWILQLEGDHPAHIVQPAIHMSTSDVARLFSKTAGVELPAELGPLAAFARQTLREKFLTADLGISGVNFGISEPGAICLVTNEGNGRMCTSLPRVHVALMGMERVVGTWRELAVMLALLGRNGTGQKLTQYTTILNGPRRRGESDGPEESHLVILDNGRSNILGTEYASVLRCIRCGACLYACPVYRQVGGHAYDPVYSGPIGAVLNPLLRGTEAAGELAHASTLCGACTEVCPVRIPLHDHLVRLRRDYARERAGRLERAAYGSWARAWSTPGRFRTFARVAAASAKLDRLGVASKVPLPVVSRWTRVRSMPEDDR